MTQAIAALRFDPALPVPWLVLLALLSIAAVSLGIWRRARGAGLRAASLALLLAWLAGPMLVRETRQGLRDIALLVVDRTASMQVGNRTELADAAAANVRAQAARIPDLELRQVSVPEHGGDGTLLWAETQRALADIPADRLAGIIAITDGQVHDLPAKPPSAPLHVLIPARHEEWDRRVRILEAPSYGIVGRTLNLRVVVEDVGHGAPGGEATLTLRRDGTPPQIRTVPVGAVQTMPIDITRAGPTVLEFSTNSPPGEASPLNDRAVVQINGVRDRLRVLLVSGEPTLDERTWRRLLKSDPAVDLVHFTILRPPERDDLTPLNELALIAFPTRELFQEKLDSFDLIILDRFTDRGILPHAYLRNIADYVRRGGALLLTAGPEFAGQSSLDQTPLTEILPAHAVSDGEGVITGQFRPVVTALGARHPVTAGLVGANAGNAAPTWGSWFRAIATEGVSGQVLMTGPTGTPLLVLSHVDQGRVALLLSDQIWLWSRGYQGGGPQAELLRRVAHWLMGEPELDEDRLSARIDNKRLIVQRRTIAGHAEAVAKIVAPTGFDQQLQLKQTSPGEAEGAMDAAAPGVWRVEEGGHTAFAAAGQDNPLEFADLRATADLIGPLVRASGGGITWLGADGPPRLLRVGARDTAAGPGWIGLRRREAHLLTGVDTTPLVPPWAALPLLLGLALAAWRREAR
ncbi:MAG TPA: hypothetical protein VMB71_03175 [Acetobacteraceae bacterium]|nr:hypothetical protein [Acetobacteraceae bacterium]